jgi:hypothetical protein
MYTNTVMSYVTQGRHGQVLLYTRGFSLGTAVYHFVLYIVNSSVPDPEPDPDPPDPHVFGPPGFFDFLSLKNDVNVPSKSNKQKKLC